MTGPSFENHSFSVSYILDEEAGRDGGVKPQVPRGASKMGTGSREQEFDQPGAMGGPQGPRHRQQDLPLRILVPTQFVGAIIGKEGLTIKNITKQTQS
ncbi:hypothetical protein M9458_001675, partial [Cirrhinus mrigala]